MIPGHRTPPPTFPPVIPQTQQQPTIILTQPGQVIPGTVPAIPREDYHPAGPGPQPGPQGQMEPPPFIPPPGLSRASIGTPRPYMHIPGTPHPLPVPPLGYPSGISGMGPNVLGFPESPSSSRTTSTRRSPSTRRRRTRSPSSRRGRRRYESRSSSGSPRRYRSSSPRPQVPLVVTNLPGTMPPPGMQPYPPVRIVSPTESRSPSLRASQQPTVIIQQPRQQYPMPPMTPLPVTHLPMSDVGTPMTGMPMTPGMVYPPPMTGVPPVILQQGSPRSSRSRSSRRRRTPPIQTQPAPVYIDTRRSQSSSPRRHTPPLTAMLPGYAFPANCWHSWCCSAWSCYDAPKVCIATESSKSKSKS